MGTRNGAKSKLPPDDQCYRYYAGLSLTFQQDLNEEMIDISYCLVIQYMPIEEVQKIGIKIDVTY